MQIIAQNPAIPLRDQMRAMIPGFLRWDASGRALLTSDAPRRAPYEIDTEKIQASGAVCFIDNNLLYIDLPPEEYERISCQTFFMPGLWAEPYIAIQSRLSGILSRGGICSGEPADISLLRASMLSCAQGGKNVGQFVGALIRCDAAALRKKQTRTVHACAAFCAHYLYTQKGIGLPDRVGVRWGEDAEG